MIHFVDGDTVPGPSWRGPHSRWATMPRFMPTWSSRRASPIAASWCCVRSRSMQGSRRRSSFSSAAACGCRSSPSTRRRHRSAGRWIKAGELHDLRCRSSLRSWPNARADRRGSARARRCAPPHGRGAQPDRPSFAREREVLDWLALQQQQDHRRELAISPAPSRSTAPT